MSLGPLHKKQLWGSELPVNICIAMGSCGQSGTVISSILLIAIIINNFLFNGTIADRIICSYFTLKVVLWHYIAHLRGAPLTMHLLH